LFSCFKISSDYSDRVGERRGRLVTPDHPFDRSVSARLQNYTNPWGDFYEESHLEEWIAREPGSIFKEREVMILASELYVYLQEKLDLLFVDRECQFYIVELKIEPIGRPGILPQRVYSQMSRYVRFLRSSKIRYLNTCYARFARRFYGKEYELSEQLQEFVGREIDSETRVNPHIHTVYVGESFDDHATAYLLRKGQQEDTIVRLIRYRFYPQQDCIEFWEVARK